MAENMDKQGWTEQLIIKADEEAQRPGDFQPMSYEEREAYLPPMVLRRSKVGGASIKTTEHPTYSQAWNQYPEAASSSNQEPRRYPVHDHIRHHEDEWQEDWKDDEEWQDDWKKAWKWQDAYDH